MSLGEKLSSIKCIIYDFAKKQCDACNLDAALSEVVMSGVYRLFQEAAYNDALLHMANGICEKPHEEMHEGTVGDLAKELGRD